MHEYEKPADQAQLSQENRDRLAGIAFTQLEHDRTFDKEDAHHDQGEDSYEGIVVNKNDLFNFLLDRQEPNTKNSTVAKQMATRVWNELGQMAKYPDWGLKFGEIRPTGKIKPRSSYKGRGWAEREETDFIDLDLGSLIRFVDSYQAIRDRFPKSLAMDAAIEFADHAKTLRRHD